jgi:hypothetical protein
MKYWEIIGDKLHRAGFSVGCVSARDKCGRTVWIVDAHGYGKRFIVRSEEILTAFLELERAIYEFAVHLTQAAERPARISPPTRIEKQPK